MGTHKSVSRCAGVVVGSSFFFGAVTLSNAVDDS
jgi:3-dehydroquinate dehydratase